MKFPASVLIVDATANAESIHMTLHDVPFKAVAYFQAALQVDSGTRFQLPDVGAFQGFVYRGDPIKTIAGFGYGKAAAIVCYALINTQLVTEWNLNFKVEIGFFGAQFEHLAHGF